MMRALGTFIIFIVGLGTGGFSVYSFINIAGLSTSENTQEISQLKTQLRDVTQKLETSEMLVEGSTDVLAGYQEKINQLQERVQTAERIAISAQQQAATATAKEAEDNAADTTPTVIASDTGAPTLEGTDSPQALASANARIQELEQLLRQNNSNNSAVEDTLNRLLEEREGLLKQLSDLQFQLSQQ